MYKILFITALFLISLFLLYKYGRNIPSQYYFYVKVTIFAVSLYLHLWLTLFTPTGDSAYFANVMTRLLNEPFFGFYQRIGITYPPLFNYLFYLLALIVRSLGIPFDWSEPAFIFCIKLPGICCSFLIAALTYSMAKKNLDEPQQIIVLALLLLNPGTLFVVSYISQVDALYTLFMTLTVYFIMNKHLKASYFCFAASILLKFQSVFITPVLMVAIYNLVFKNNFSWKRFFAELFTGLAAIACMFVAYLPFIYDFKNHIFAEGGLFHNFTSSLESYGLASQNSCNFWTLIGYNWESSSSYLGPFTCDTWGIIFIVLLVLLCFLLFAQSKKTPDIYPMLGALLVSGTYCFSVKMMPRYLFPAIPLLILGYVAKPTFKRLLCAVLYSAAFFLSVCFDYILYPQNVYNKELIPPYLLSAFVLFCFGILVYTIKRDGKKWLG